MPELQFLTLASGLGMGYVDVGPRDGASVILLHGFPEFHHSWRLQWPALADAGYRVIVPDQRGYNQTDKTPPYDLNTLARDVAQLQDALGVTPSHIVGHDWGGVVAYGFAHRYPDRVDKLMWLNVPHPNAYLDSVLSGNWRQMLMSWYVYFFQLPKIPERAIARNQYAFFDRAFAKVKHMTAQDIAAYKQAASQPGALTAMIDWYRTQVRRMFAIRFRLPVEMVHAPTLVIWGERDLALTKPTNDTLTRYVPKARVVYLPEASHWVQMDAPEEVNRLMVEFLRK